MNDIGPFVYMLSRMVPGTHFPDIVFCTCLESSQRLKSLHLYRKFTENRFTSLVRKRGDKASQAGESSKEVPLSHSNHIS